MGTGSKWVTLCVLILIGFLFYLGCLNFVEPSEIGIARNFVSGDMWIEEGNGWNISAPGVLVSRIDMRPMRVGVPSAGHGFSAKLVQFDKEHWQEFVTTEGFYYYWWANRISFNWSYESYRGVKDIFRGYAYSVKQYPFLKIVEEYDTK